MSTNIGKDTWIILNKQLVPVVYLGWEKNVRCALRLRCQSNVQIQPYNQLLHDFWGTVSYWVDLDVFRWSSKAVFKCLNYQSKITHADNNPLPKISSPEITDEIRLSNWSMTRQPTQAYRRHLRFVHENQIFGYFPYSTSIKPQEWQLIVLTYHSPIPGEQLFSSVMADACAAQTDVDKSGGCCMCNLYCELIPFQMHFFVHADVMKLVLSKVQHINVFFSCSEKPQLSCVCSISMWLNILPIWKFSPLQVITPCRCFCTWWKGSMYIFLWQGLPLKWVMKYYMQTLMIAPLLFNPSRLVVSNSVVNSNLNEDYNGQWNWWKWLTNKRISSLKARSVTSK